MTYALSLILWMATAQTAGQPVAAHAAGPVATPAAVPTATPATVPTAAPAAPPATVVVQCPPSDAERALQDQFDEMRGQLDEALRDAAEAKEQVAKLKEEAGMPDHAVATLLLSDHPNLAPLHRISREAAPGSGLGRVRYVRADVYVSPHPDESIAAVVLTTRNPRELPTWEPREAFIMTPSYHGGRPVPVALRSSPERIRPGETAQIALVFNLADVEWYEDYITLALFRDGKWEMETELPISDFRVGSAKPRGDQ